MNDGQDPLARIADALERLSPPAQPVAGWGDHPAYVWDGFRARPVVRIQAPDLELLRGIDAQKDFVVTNVMRHAAGHAAHDMLL